MSQSGAAAFPSNDERELYKLFRDRIGGEDLLVFHRLSWLLIGQSILFGAWAAAFFRKPDPGITHDKTVALAIVGLLLLAVIYPGIVAAVCSIEGLRRSYNRLHTAQGGHNPFLPPLVSWPWPHLCGLLVPLLLPLVFLAGWLIVLFGFSGNPPQT